MNFIDGEPEAVRALLRHALRRYTNTELGTMVPAASAETSPIGLLLDEFAFEPPAGSKPDVFAYELLLEDETDAGWPIGYDGKRSPFE